MIIESIRNFIKTCPHLKDNRIVNVDYLGNSVQYSIDGVPGKTLISKYADGGKKKQFIFTFSSTEYYGKDFMVNMENQGFYEKFSNWLEKKNDKYELPILEDGKESISIEVLDSGYLYHADEDLAKYQMQARLVYYED